MTEKTLPPRHQLKYDYKSPLGFVLNSLGLPSAALYETVEGFFVIRAEGLPSVVYTSWDALTSKVNNIALI